MVLRKSFYIHWSAGRSPRVLEVNPGRDLSGSIAGSIGSTVGSTSLTTGSKKNDFNL